MSLLGMEGFDWVPTSAANINARMNTKTLWSASIGSGFNKVAGLLGGFGVNMNTGSFTLTPGGSYGTLISGTRVKTGAAFGLGAICSFLDGASVQSGFCFTAAGKVAIFRGTTATLLETGSTTLQPATWYSIELRITFSTSGNSDGSYELRIDGATELSASGTADTTTTANASATACTWGGGGFGQGITHDDLYLCDTSGGVANDFLGTPRIETLYVTSNNSVTFTPLSSTNASNVDEVSEDGDTTYNSSASTGQIDTFNHDSLSSTPSTIHGVEILAVARKDDVTAQTVRTKLISGGTTQNGTSVAVPTTFRVLSDLYTVDPNTAAAWTGANVNATKIGYEHV